MNYDVNRSVPTGYVHSLLCSGSVATQRCLVRSSLSLEGESLEYSTGLTLIQTPSMKLPPNPVAPMVPSYFLAAFLGFFSYR